VRAESRNFSEIEQIRTDEGAEAAANIGQLRGVYSRQDQRHDAGHQRWNENGHGDAEAGYRLGKRVACDRNNGDGDGGMLCASALSET